MYLPKYLSYSAVNSYEECPRSWYLSYAKRAEKRQTWYLPMGTVVHNSIEEFLTTGDVPEFESLFYPLIANQLKIDPDHAKWLSAGSGQNLMQGDDVVELGKKCVANALKFLKNFEVWEVEYDASGMLPGCEVPVKGFVDLIGEHKLLGPLIVDWKSGKNKPGTTFQLEVYNALLRMPLPNGSDHPFTEHGSLLFNGYWAMLHPDARPKTDRGRFVDLSGVDPEAVGARFQKAYEGMKKKVYQANVRFACQFCFQQDNCIPNVGGTARALYYDDAEEKGFPF